MTVFDRMKQKKKEEYTLGELVTAYLFGCGLPVAGGSVGAASSVWTFFGMCGAEGVFIAGVCLFLMVFGIGVYNYLDMGRW